MITELIEEQHQEEICKAVNRAIERASKFARATERVRELRDTKKISVNSNIAYQIYDEGDRDFIVKYVGGFLTKQLSFSEIRRLLTEKNIPIL
jgi:predicted PP-loop superfamily ATPase